MKATWRLALAACAVLVLVGCKSGGSSAPPPPLPDGATRSTIFNVPVPVGAEHRDDLSNDTTDAYRFPTVDFEALKEFYDKQMPEHRAFDGHAFCDAGTTENEGATTIQRTWHTGGDDFLVLQIIDDPAHEPGVLIYDDKDDPDPSC